MAIGVVLALPAVASAESITGTAFEDFNDNGTRNSSPAVDAGVGGITVTAYGRDGAALANTTTAADGTYTLNVPDGVGEVRVEFTDLPAGYQPARHGAASGTTVQFVDGPAAGVDVGVLQPFNFCQDNPQIAVACMRFGAHDDPAGNAEEASIRIAPDTTADQTTPNPADDTPVPGEVTGATFAQTGSVFGVVQPTGSRFLYSAAFTKRHADWGPGGPGAIYRTDIAQANAGTPNANEFFDVNDLPGDPAGMFARGAGVGGVGSGDWANDSLAWDQVGNSGLGNLSSNFDGSELYTVGLATRQLIQIPIPADGSSPDPSSVDAFAVPSPCAPAGDARPMGTGWHDGLLYVGGVCSMASVGNPPSAALVGDVRMRVYVYTFDPATGTFSAAPVLDAPLEANRLCIGRSNAVVPFPFEIPVGCTSADWHPWTSQSTLGAINTAGHYAQPVFADIEFAGDDLVLGIRDRSPDQMGVASVFPDGTPGESGTQSGYTLRACRTGGGYALESNGVCGGLTTSGPRDAAGWGPGGARFYWQQYYNTLSPTGGPSLIGASHDYAGLGGTLSIPGYPELRLASGYGANECPPGLEAAGCTALPGPEPHGPHSSGGVLYLDKADGSRVRGFNFYTGGGNAPGEPLNTFAKSNGLGDLEALCEAAPIEIGNYVWLDPDRDGVQDAGETRLSGVTVELLDGAGAVVATTSTDANGQYFFNESNVPGAVQPKTDYAVRISLEQAVLAPYVPTGPDASQQLRDSDGITEGRYVVDRLTTGAAGHNDHTHDFGFHEPVPEPPTPPVPFQPPPPPPPADSYNVRIDKSVSRERVRLGDSVSYRLVVTNDGPATATEVTVTDTLPSRVDARSANSSQGNCTVDDNDVACTVGTMASGQSETITVEAVAIRTGRAINAARVAAPRDRDPSDNADAVPVQIVKPQLGLTKAADKRTLRPGERVTYTIRTRNPSRATLRNVRTCDDLPPELAYVRSTPRATLRDGQYCWTVSRLAAGRSRTYRLTARALPGIRPGSKINRATATSPDAETRRANRTVRVRAGAGRAGGVTG